MTEMDRKETMWCTLCGARFTDAEIKGWGCPKCGSQGVPCGCDGDVCAELNWHELHILICWAERHAATDRDPKPTMTAVVTAIARRLQAQFPEMPPLTLAQEISELPTKLAEAGVGILGLETNIHRPIPIPVNGPGAVGHSRSPAKKQTEALERAERKLREALDATPDPLRQRDSVASAGREEAK